MNDARKVYFVVSLRRPVRAGQKHYYHFVMQYEKATVVHKSSPVAVNLKQAEIDERYPGRGIQEEMSGH